MIDDRRKLLCAMTGREYHEYTVGFETGGLSQCSCGRTGCAVLDYCGKQNQDFDTPDDQHAVMQAICKAGKWCDFACFASRKWCEANKGKTLSLSGDSNVIDFTEWLFSDPSRFCELAGEWAEKER